MAVRRDGIQTRERLLEAGLEIFTRDGYHAARVSEIGRRAGAGAAAVSYHFGGKEHLYAEVWKRAFAAADRKLPIDGGLPPDASPEDRLRAFVGAILSRILRHGAQSRSGRLLLMELARPVEALRTVRLEATRPIRERIRGLVRELLGPDADDDGVNRSAMSVMHQMLATGFMGGRKSPLLGDGPFTDDEIDALIDHVVRFSLGGIAAVAPAGAGR